MRAEHRCDEQRVADAFVAMHAATGCAGAVTSAPGAAAAQLVAVEANATSTLSARFDGRVLALRPNGLYDFVLFNFGVREANGWALIGEVRGKWVGVSSARVQRIQSDAATLDVVVRGAPGESVTLTFAKPTGRDTVDVECTVGQGSTVRFSMPEAGCY